MDTTIRRGDMLVYLNDEAISVNAYYRQHGFAALPPTPTLPGYEIQMRSRHPWNPSYSLVLVLPDGGSRVIGGQEAVPVHDGMDFMAIPPATYHA